MSILNLAKDTWRRSSVQDRVSGLSLIAAMILYGGASSSTPENIGAAEALIASLLVVAVGPASFIRAITPARGTKNDAPVYVRAHFVLMLFLPSAIGLVFNGNTTGDYIRDIIPFLYMSLPILLVWKASKNPEIWLRYLIASLLIPGVLFAYRHFQEAGAAIQDVGTMQISGGGSYFPMDPSVLFTATFGFSFGTVLLLTGVRHAISGSSFLLLGTLPYLSLLAIVVRAQIAMVVAALGATLMLTLKSNGAKGLVLFSAVIFIISLTQYDTIYRILLSAYELALAKHESVGLSGRDLELRAVINNADTASLILFGEGWGGLILNPTGRTAGYWRWVHNYFAYAFFKGGVIGLVSWTLYAGWIISALLQTLKNIHPMKAALLFAVSAPIALNLTLEPGFKMLSFGLVMTIAVLLSTKPSQHQPKLATPQ